MCDGFSGLSKSLSALTSLIVEMYHSSPRVSVSLVMNPSSSASGKGGLIKSEDQEDAMREQMGQRELTVSLQVDKAGEWPLPESE